MLGGELKLYDSEVEVTKVEIVYVGELDIALLVVWPVELAISELEGLVDGDEGERESFAK